MEPNQQNKESSKNKEQIDSAQRGEGRGIMGKKGKDKSKNMYGGSMGRTMGWELTVGG